MANNISNAFLAFSQEAPLQAKAWAEMIGKFSEASILDVKTSSLIYIAVLAALGIETGIPYHVMTAKNAGASKEEIINAVLIGLPPAGHKVTQALPLVIEAYENRS